MSDVLDAIKAKYPQYANVPSEKLTLAIAQKYPGYLKHQDFLHEFSQARISEDRRAMFADAAQQSIKEHAAPSTNPLAVVAGDVNQPLLDVTPEEATAFGHTSRNQAQAAEDERVRTSGTPLEKRALGVRTAMDQFLSGMTSPLSLGTLGLGGAIEGGGKLLSALFAAQTGKQLSVDTAQRLGKAYAKPADQRDPEEIANLWASTGVNTPFAAALGVHALSPGPTPAMELARLLREQPLQGTPKGAEPAKPLVETVKRGAGGAQGETVKRGVGETAKESVQTGGRPTTKESEVPNDTQARREVPRGEPNREEPGNVPQPGGGGETAAPGGVLQTSQEVKPAEAGTPNKPPAAGDVPSPEQSAAAAGAPVRVARGVRARKVFDAETAMQGPDILSWISENMPMMSKTVAKAQRGKEWFRQNGSLYDDAAPLQRPHHNLIYGGTSAPDQVAQAAYEAGMLKNPDVNDLWTAIRQASNRRAKAFATARSQEAALQNEIAAHNDWLKKSQQGEQHVAADDLKVGDQFDVADQRIEVTHVDPDTGEVTLKDGSRFGVQKLSSGGSLHVENYAPTEEAGFEPETQKVGAMGSAPFELAKPESVDEQKQRLAAEEQQRQAAANKEKLAQLAAKPLIGSRGDIGQGDLLGGGDLLSMQKQIRTTEQNAEPGLAEASKEFGSLGVEEVKNKVNAMGSAPHVGAPRQPATVQTAPVQGLAGARPSGALKPGRQMQLIIRAYLGREYGQVRSLDTAFRSFKRYFDKSPKPRGYVYQAGDELAGKMPKGWQVQWAIDSGNTAGLTSHEQNFAKAYRAAMDWAVKAVQEVSPESLRDLYENYFGRIWKDPEKNANVIRQWINARPLEGSKSFLKERVLKDWIDGIKMGLEPLSDNPVDMMLYKVGEMVQFAGARMMKQEAKQLGLRKFFYLGEKVPEGWRVDPDPKGEVFAPPVVTIKEAYDEQIRTKTTEMLDKLGIPHQRLASLGGKRWGLAFSKPDEKIQTKFGGPDFVYWHEFGHIMDYRFPDLRKMLGMTARQIAGKMVQGAGRTTEDMELRALADLRGANKAYARKAEEKMANVFHAYLHAPELFEQTAPTVFKNFESWLQAHPDVRNLMADIKPSLKLGVNETTMKLAGPVLLGHWAMPEPALRVLENFQSKSFLSGKPVVAGLRAVNGLLTSARLFGFFHGGLVTDDSFYGGLSLILNDALRGRLTLSEAGKNLLMVPRAFMLGGKVRGAIEDPASATAVNQELGKLALEANLRSHIGAYDLDMGRRWQRAFNELKTAPSIGAAWETFWRAPFAAMAQTMRPVMDGLVPRMKYGMNGLQTMRVLQDLPGVREILADDLFERSPQFQSSKSRSTARQQLETDLSKRLELRDQLAKSADSVEDRIGQVTYDNLFLNKTLKDASTLGLTAFGWHLTKYRGLFGAAADWARAAGAVARGQKPEITFRMTYLPAMVMGHAIIGGILHYALTRKRPQSAMDLLFPESGLIDAYGKPIRLAIADYVKDIMGDINAFRFHGVRGEVGRQVGRLAPAWNMAAEMYRNKDFWGNQIFETRMPGEPESEHLLKVLGEGVKYLAGSSAPFSARAGDKLQQAGGNKVLSYAAPLFGVVPAPRDATMTPSQALADDISAQHRPVGGRTPAEAQRAQAVADIVRDTRTGKINNQGDFEQRERAAGVKTKQQETAIKERVLWTPYQRSVWLMSLDDAMKVWDLASDQEKLQLVKFRPGSDEGLAKKVQTAAASGRLDKTTAQRYVSLLLPYWKRAVEASKRPSVQAPNTGRQPFRAMQLQP